MTTTTPTGEKYGSYLNFDENKQSIKIYLTFEEILNEYLILCVC